MRDTNRQLLIAASRLLRPLLADLVFVGGCATGTLITDEAAADVRATIDVDTIRGNHFLPRMHRFWPQTESCLIALEKSLQIRRISAPFFLATKLEAFKGRGRGDFVGSHDLEDVLAVIDGRPELSKEVRSQAADLRSYLALEFSKLLRNSRFVDAISAHLLPDAASQSRVSSILKTMEALSGI